MSAWSSNKGALVQHLEIADLQAWANELRSRYHSLTARQRLVMAGIVAGRLNKHIAAALRIAERTAKAHRSQVMQKMGVRSVADLVRIARELSSCGEPMDPWRDE